MRFINVNTRMPTRWNKNKDCDKKIYASKNKKNKNYRKNTVTGNNKNNNNTRPTERTQLQVGLRTTKLHKERSYRQE